MGLDEANLGLAASCFFGAAAVATLAGGAFMDRLSGRASTFTAAALSATACLGIAWGVTTLTGLLLLLAVGGLGNALLQGTGNVMLAHAVPPSRRGMAYGIKQSAIPVAVITGGLAAPTVGALVGWGGRSPGRRSCVWRWPSQPCDRPATGRSCGQQPLSRSNAHPGPRCC